MIPVSRPDFGADESAAAQTVLESQWVGMGPQTERFETALASYLGVRHVVATSSCTAALHLAMASLEHDGRSEVIVPSLTFAATIQAILMAGYKPVFAEVEPGTLCLDGDDVAGLLGPQTRAILPVHFAGQPCDMERLEQLAKPFAVDVVADAAHAFGSTYHGAAIGRQGAVTCFSFSSNKNISSAEGGALVTESDALADRSRQLRFLGISQHTWARRNQERPWHYAVVGAGFRYHMSDINAAIGLAQLHRLSEFASRRREIAAIYDVALRDLPWTVPIRRELAHTIPNLYVLRVTHGLRDALHVAMRAIGVECGVHYVPNHLQPGFNCFARSLPVTEQLAAEVISLPLHTRLTPAQIEHIIAAVSRFLKHAKPANEAQSHRVYTAA